MSTSAAWRPLSRAKDRWLLTNGQIITTPDLEISPAGRKVRIAGSKKSVGSGYSSQIIEEAVRALADQKGTNVWCSCAPDAPSDYTGDLKLHFTEGKRYYETNIWWSFRHPSLPIEAVLRVTAKLSYGTVVEVSCHVTATRLNPTWVSANEKAVYRSGQWISIARQNAIQQRVSELMRDDPQVYEEMPSDFFQETHFPTFHKAVEGILKRIREFEDLSEIPIPDLLDNDNPKWMSLALYDTNVTGEFIQTLVDFLDTAASMKDVLAAYEELRKAMTRLGFVLPERSEDDLSSALNTDNASMYVTLSPVWNANSDNTTEQSKPDDEHTVYLHLTSGCLLVSCTKTDMRDQAGQAWEEAITVASLTGQQSNLLAFANEYVKNNAEGNARKFANSRRVGL
jgi:hypothetical protein